MTIAIIAIVVVLIFWAMTTYNGLIGLRNKVDEGFSTMDVYLKKRFDQLPNLVNIVKGYAKHEAETLERIIRMRSQGGSSSDDAIEQEKQISEAIRQINVVVERYPDLKANENFLRLQDQLSGIEEDISKARRYYNGCVREYNDKCQMMPSNLIANAFGFKTRKMFEVDSAAERKNVTVEF